MKTGVFKVVDQDYAERVARISKFMHDDCGIKHAMQHLVVAAISRIALVTAFDNQRFMDKVRSHGHLFAKCATLADYLDQIDMIYNRQSKDRVPLKFMSDELARERTAVKRPKHNA